MNGLRCEQLDVRVGTVQVCRQLDLDILPGQHWALLGRNGAGKTTLLHTLAGLRAPQGGSIWVNGTTLQQQTRKQLAAQLGILFQDEQEFFPGSVLESTLIGRHPHMGWLQSETDEDVQLCQQALAKTGLEDMQQRDPTTLSGGEYRRMLIARLLTQDPSIALLDEPSNHLDLHHQLESLQLLSEHFAKRVMLMSIHDINLALRYCSHALLLMGNGEILAGPIHEVITSDSLENLYGVAVEKMDSSAGSIYIPR